MFDQELFESAKQTLQEEALKKSGTIKTLNEWGLHYLQRGLNQNEFSHHSGSIRTVPYRQVYGDLGFTRCNICLNDFQVGDKIKQFPQCDHMFHIRCLDLWVTVEPRCPNCLQEYSPVPTPPGQGSLVLLHQKPKGGGFVHPVLQ